MATTLYSGTVSTSAYSSKKDTVFSNAYTFRLEVIENSTDTLNNLSNVTTNVYIKGSSSSWYYSGYNSAKAVVDRTLPDGTSGNIINQSYPKHSQTSSEVLIKSFTENILHNQDGTGTVSYQFNWNGANPGKVSSGLPKSCSLSSGNLTLTQIQRAPTLSASPALLKSGNESITIANAIPGTTYTLTFEAEGGGGPAQTQTVSMGTQTSKTILFSYNKCKQVLGSRVSGTIIVSVPSGIVGIDPVTTRFKVYTGNTVPISLYDDREGHVGVHFGQEAVAAGIYIDDEGPLTLQTITVDGVTYKVLGLRV